MTQTQLQKAHEELNDIDKDVVMADIESWIAAHLRG